jgi:hypothetical protein
MGKPKKKRPPRRELAPMRLLYNIANGGLVFAESKRARFISRIHDAINGSSTWEQFRRAMPRAEYSKVIREWFDEEGEPRPRGSDEFDASMVPGYCDGDYPDWLQQEMDELLPEEILDEFAEIENTMLNGYYVQIDPEKLPAIKARLEQLGYVVVDGTNLSFY